MPTCTPILPPAQAAPLPGFPSAAASGERARDPHFLLLLEAGGQRPSWPATLGSAAPRPLLFPKMPPSASSVARSLCSAPPFGGPVYSLDFSLRIPHLWVRWPRPQSAGLVWRFQRRRLPRWRVAVVTQLRCHPDTRAHPGHGPSSPRSQGGGPGAPRRLDRPQPRFFFFFFCFDDTSF